MEHPRPQQAPCSSCLPASRPAGAAPTPAAAASSGWGSPAEFLGFPGGTPGAAGLRSPSVDGVPRDADGIPMLTPTTVTVRRRSSTRELGVVLEEGADPLAADLFDSFSPLGSGARAFSPGGSMGGFGSPAAAEEAPAAWAQQAEATPAGTAADGFSFFPAGPAAAEGAAADGSQGATPEMPAGAAAAAAAGGAAAAYVSPEILGFYEQRTAGAAAAGTAAGSSHAAASAAATPAMPR